MSNKNEDLVMLETLNPNFVTLEALRDSVASEKVEKALKEKYGDENGADFLKFVREADLLQVTKTFRISPVAQYRREGAKRGKGAHVFSAVALEDALMTAYCFVRDNKNQ